jgi:hypothetical protein
MGEALRDFLYEAYPAFNAGKLGEFVSEMVEANRQRELAAPAVDDTRRLRALTRDDFVTNEDSVLFRMRDAGGLVTRQNSQGKPRPKPSAPQRPAAPPPLPSLPVMPNSANSADGAGGAARQPAPKPNPNSAGARPAPASALTAHTQPPLSGERPRARISNWPLEEANDEPTELWSLPAFAPPAPRAAAPVEDSEPTARYAPRHLVPLLSVDEDAPTHSGIPSVLPSLSPPAPRNPFDDPPLTGTGKLALVPPRGETHSLGPIPPSPPVPDFRPSSGIPWIPILLGLASAVLGIVGYQAIPRSGPSVHLEIVSAPSGANVRVDGRLQDSKTPLRLSGLEQGHRYAVAVELTGYQPWVSTHLAGETSVQQIAVLKPIVRTLIVDSTPEGADVFLGDTLVGRTPLSLPSMQVAKPLRLRLELAGHRSALREVTIDPADPHPRASFVLVPR